MVTGNSKNSRAINCTILLKSQKSFVFTFFSLSASLVADIDIYYARKIYACFRVHVNIWQADSTEYVENRQTTVIDRPHLHFMTTLPCEIYVFISRTENSHKNSQSVYRKRLINSTNVANLQWVDK